MLEQLSGNLKNLLIYHHVSCFLVVHLLVKRFQSIPQSFRLQLLVQENILELGDHSVKDCCGDLRNKAEKLDEECSTECFDNYVPVVGRSPT